jgi:hypothetical protein
LLLGDFEAAIQMLTFTLIYDGALPSSGGPNEKQMIRRAFHPQLKVWWEAGPLAATFKEIDKNNLAGVQVRAARSGFWVCVFAFDK